MKKINQKKHKQQGIALVEFTIVATLFFLVIFSIIEFGRLLFTWHALNEISRRSARLATVCQVTAPEQLDAITAAVMDDIPLPNFSVNNIQIRYLDGTGSPAPEPLDEASNFNEIEFIEATITDYQLDLIIPFTTLIFKAPEFKTVLPRESLGVTRTGFTDC